MCASSLPAAFGGILRNVTPEQPARLKSRLGGPACGHPGVGVTAASRLFTRQCLNGWLVDDARHDRQRSTFPSAHDDCADQLSTDDARPAKDPTRTRR